MELYTLVIFGVILVHNFVEYNHGEQLNVPRHRRDRPGHAHSKSRDVVQKTSGPSNYKNELRSFMASASTGLNGLTIKLDQAIENERENPSDNIVLSPVSLQLALAMMLLASNGKTFEEIRHVLNLNHNKLIVQNTEFAHYVLSHLLRNYDNEDSKSQDKPLRKLASGIFVQSSFPIREQYQAACERFYKSQVFNVDFQQNGTGAQDFINKWVKDKTLNKISEVLANPPDPLTDLIMLSTMYFEGQWEKKFDVAEDRMPFNIKPGNTVYVNMLYQNSEFPYYEDEELKIVGLPYKGREVMMYLILPTSEGPDGLRDVKRNLNTEKLDALISKMEDRTLLINLPKMELSSSISLKNVLKTLGLSTIFNPNTADFSFLSESSRRNSPSQAPPSNISGSDDQPSSPSTGSSIVTPDTLLTPTSIIDEGCTEMQQVDLYTYTCEVGEYVYILEMLPNGHKWQKVPRSKWGRREHSNHKIGELQMLSDPANPGIYVSDIIQAVKITVDEKGTEAAAATVVEIGMRFGLTDYFVADRPFLLFIQHVKTKSIWFWGSISTPQPSYQTRMEYTDD